MKKQLTKRDRYYQFVSILKYVDTFTFNQVVKRVAAASGVSVTDIRAAWKLEQAKASEAAQDAKKRADQVKSKANTPARSMRIVEADPSAPASSAAGQDASDSQQSSSQIFDAGGMFRGAGILSKNFNVTGLDDKAWAEFGRCAENRVHIHQAWLQCRAMGWLASQENSFSLVYSIAFGNWLTDVAGCETGDEWPVDGEAERPDKCRLKYLAMGGGDFWDYHFQARVPNPREVYPALPACQIIIPGYWDDKSDTYKPARLKRDRAYGWALANNDLPPGYRAVERVSGLCVESFGDKDRVNDPVLMRSDAADRLSPIKWGAYRFGERAHYYLPLVADDDNDYTEGQTDAQVAVVRLYDALSALADVFPGYDEQYLGFLLCSSLVTDMDPSAVQRIIFASGPSGSGKTTHCEIAAELLGDLAYEIRINDDLKNAEQRIGYAVQSRARICVMDEFDKLYMQKQRDRMAVTSLMLSLKRYFTFNQKFRDDKQIEVRTLFVLTGTAVPPDFGMQQLARRTIEFELRELPPDVDWKLSSGGISDWRCRTDENADIADNIVSRAYDVVKAANFNHLAVEAAFSVRRMNEHYNDDAVTSRNAWRRLYMVWLHSARAVAGLEYNQDWGMQSYMHPKTFVASSIGYLDILLSDVQRFQILEDIFSGVDSERSSPEFIKLLFDRRRGEQGFLRDFGLYDDFEACKCYVYCRGRKLGIKFAMYSLGKKPNRNNAVPLESMPDLEPELIAELGTPPTPSAWKAALDTYESDHRAIEDELWKDK